MSRVKSFRFSDSPEDQAFGDRLLNALQPIKEGVMENEVTLVLAGDYEQFRRFLDERGYSPFDPRYMYVADARRLYGARNRAMVRVGTWRERKDLAEILEAAEANGIEVVE